MNFMSDNVTGAAPEIMAALAAANDDAAPPYGNDAVTERLTERLATVFGHDVAVFPVATGSAANGLALSALTPPWGAVYCARNSHVDVDECGGPELFCGGAKLLPLPVRDGRIQPDTLAGALAEAPFGFVHAVQPAALSLTQLTECGTLYTPAEITALTSLAKGKGLRVHMDGARFANALATLGCHPADITWRAGVDVLCLGATKNGAFAAEAVVFFDQDLARDFGYRRKRFGHLFSKMRFLSAQLDRYVQDGLWLRLAGHANAMAARLSGGLAALPGVRLAYPTQGNEVFVDLPEPLIQGLEAAGVRFYRWEGTVCRFVCAWNTPAAAVDGLLAVAAGVES